MYATEGEAVAVAEVQSQLKIAQTLPMRLREEVVD